MPPPLPPLLKPVVEAVEIEVFAQSADPVRPGAATGFTPLEMIKEAGGAAGGSS